MAVKKVIISKPKILYVGDTKTKKFDFYEMLKENYDVKDCSYVLPAAIEKNLGRLKFSYINDPQDSGWNSYLGNSLKDVVYQFGIDPLLSSDNDFSFHFKFVLLDYLKKLKFKTPSELSLKNILQIKNEKFITEKAAFEYDLVIINTLVEKVTKFEKLTSGEVEIDPTFNSLIKNYYVYKIAPELIRSLLKSGKKLLFLMDYDSSPILDNEASSGKERLVYSLQRAGISYPELGFNFLSGVEVKIDKKSISVKKDFEISMDEYFYESVSPKYKHIFDKVKSVHVDEVFQIKAVNKDGIEDRTKILLGSNENSSFIFREDQDSFIPISFEKVRNDSYSGTIDNRLGVFGVLDSDDNNCYCMLTGNVCADKYFGSSKYNNKKFIKNILNCLLNPQQCKRNSEFGLIPKIVLIVKKRELFIHNRKLNLEPVEFSFYRYFLERAKKKEGELILDGLINLKEYTKEAASYIPTEVFEEILNLYEESFEDEIGNWPAALKYNQIVETNINVNLKGERKNKVTPTIDNFKNTIYSINTKIKKFIEESDPYMEEEYLDMLLIKIKKDHYKINLAPEYITIKLPNSK